MALLFAVVAPAVILYSSGYVFDFKNPGLVSTGGIFIKTDKTGAKVFLDSEFSKETSFISRGALISNLIPKRYAVRVEKDGFQPWQKVVRVADEEVLEFRNVFLPPATITPSAVFNTRKSLPSRLKALPGRPDVAVEVGNPSKSFTVFVVNPDTRLSPINLIKVSRWRWDEYSKTFVIGRNVDGLMRWYRLAPGVGGSGREELINFRGLPVGFSADDVRPHPAETDQFYFFAGGALFLQGNTRVPVPIAEQIASYLITGDRLYFLNRNGFFAESNLDGGDTKILGRKGLFLGDGSPVRILSSPKGDIAVVDAAGGLFVYQPVKDQELGFVYGNAAGVDFSSSGDRMLFWDDHRLWIYWLSDNPEQPFDLARTKKQIFYSDAKIRQAYLNDEGTHIFFATDNGVRMTETDDRGSINSYDLLTHPVDSFLLDKNGMTLYWLEGPVLYKANLE